MGFGENTGTFGVVKNEPVFTHLHGRTALFMIALLLPGLRETERIMCISRFTAERMMGRM